MTVSSFRLVLFPIVVACYAYFRVRVLFRSVLWSLLTFPQ